MRHIYMSSISTSVEHFQVFNILKCGNAADIWVDGYAWILTFLNVQHLQVSNNFNLFKPVEHQKL